MQSLNPCCNNHKNLDKFVRNLTNTEWSVEYTDSEIVEAEIEFSFL